MPNAPTPVRLASVSCWLRFCSVWAGYGVGHADNAPLHPTHPVPEVVVAEQQKKPSQIN